MYHTVYSGGPTEGAPESIIVARPTLNIAHDRVKTKLEYDPAKLVPAWDLFVKAVPQIKPTEGFRYDLVDLTRQVLGNYASPLQQKIAVAYQQKDLAAFQLYSNQFLGLLDDMDTLLGTQEGFLLGKWVSDARSNGITEEERNLYEFNAKDLVTLWGDKDSPLHEYSNRQWNGLIKGFYKPRWQQFFKLLTQDLQTGKKADLGAFEAQVKDFEWKWATGHDKYASKPQGDAVKTVVRLYGKYRKFI
jgi:alpha-N-acetylglucosaminidase